MIPGLSWSVKPVPLGQLWASVGFSRRRYDSPSITSSKAALCRRSMADWASIGSAMNASHSYGGGTRLLEVIDPASSAFSA